MTIITLYRLCNIGYKPFLFLIFLLLFQCKDRSESSDTGTLSDAIIMHPISHATFILKHKDLVIYVDPVGGAKTFQDFDAPNIILITDIHGDHLSIETIEGLQALSPRIVAPQAVADKIPENLKTNLSVVANFQSITLTLNKVALGIEGIPMYNLREEALEFHIKDRGNGYVLTLDGERIYISGDTEDIPEMRSLKNIDRAFICMNLPWTMPIESAASAVLEFQPKNVFPYHYKGSNGLSDIKKFKDIINSNSSIIDVHLLNWYPNR